MKYGIIDLGSNTVKLLIYKPKNEKLEVLYEKREVAGLASYLLPEGYLSDLGIERAISTVLKLKKHANNFGVDKLYVVATAVVRNSRNHNEIVNRITQNTGLNVILLSGLEEAKYGVLGVLNEFNIEEGLVIDIGGGSTEVSIIKPNIPSYSTSLPVGCLNSYITFVKDILPTENEQLLIEKSVLTALKTENVKKDSISTIYGIGGTIKALFKLYTSYTNKKKDYFTKTDLDLLFNKIKLNNKSTYLHLIRVVPERLHTIMPGLVILKTLLKYFNSSKIYKCSNGLREGFILNQLKLEKN